MDVGIKKNNTEKLKGGWKTIKRNIKRVGDLTQDLLTYSKNREPEFELCNPNTIVEELHDLIEEFAKNKDVGLSIDLDKNVGEIMADPQTIHRSLLNLINNAIDACLEDENTSKKHGVTIKTYKTDSAVCFDVSDNGCGMDENTREQLFNPMFSSKGGKGTGLGLLVTGKLIEEHQGSINIETEPGAGSTFTIQLPLDTENLVDIN